MFPVQCYDGQVRWGGRSLLLFVLLLVSLYNGGVLIGGLGFIYWGEVKVFMMWVWWVSQPSCVPTRVVFSVIFVSPELRFDDPLSHISGYNYSSLHHITKSDCLTKIFNFPTLTRRNASNTADEPDAQIMFSLNAPWKELVVDPWTPECCRLQWL